MQEAVLQALHKATIFTEIAFCLAVKKGERAPTEAGRIHGPFVCPRLAGSTASGTPVDADHHPRQPPILATIDELEQAQAERCGALQRCPDVIHSTTFFMSGPNVSRNDKAPRRK